MQRNQKRRELLEYIAIFSLIILAGMLNDILTCVLSTDLDTHNTIQHLCREFRTLGFSLLLFKVLSYNRIKLKTLSFMFIIWSSIIILYNSLLPDTHSMFFVIPLYVVYVWWLFRIALLGCYKEYEYTKNQLKYLEKYGVAYNILLPVKTFRGLLQTLFLPFRNPLYETRILIADHEIIGIKNKKFIKIDYNEDYIEPLIKNGYKIRECVSYKKCKIDKLIGKKLVLLFNDCSKLEV